jgi:hypothetical protein
VTTTTGPSDARGGGSRRRPFLRATLLLLALSLSVAAAWAGAAREGPELFRIARSTNQNVVVYRTRVGAGGQIDPARPIQAYWLMNAEDGHREELTWLERQVAYGFSVASVDGGFRLALSACDERPLFIHRVDGRYRAEVSIAGRASYLSRIWVEVGGGLLGPTVRHLVLEGTDVHSGGRTTERVGG